MSALPSMQPPLLTLIRVAASGFPSSLLLSRKCRRLFDSSTKPCRAVIGGTIGSAMRFSPPQCKAAFSLGVLALTFASFTFGASDQAMPVENSSLSQREEIRVADFGAVPDDGNNDSQAFLAAFEKSKEFPASTLILEKGVYDIFHGSSPDSSEVIFFLEHLRNLTLEGNGAELRVRTWNPLFRIHDSVGMVIRNLTVDWHPLPHAAGRVTEIDREARSFVLRLEPTYLPPFPATVDLVVGYDAITKFPPQVPQSQNFLVAQNYTRKTEAAGPELLRVFMSGKPRTITSRASELGGLPEVGSHVALRFTARGCNAFLLQNCDQTLFEDVSVYSAPGMGVSLFHCTDVTLRRVRVEPRPGADRWMSTCVDATHFNFCRGSILVEDCVFIGQEDDGSNVHNMYMRVHRRVGDRVVEIEGGRGYDVFQPDPLPRAGDILEFSLDKNPYLAEFTANIEEVSFVPTRADGKARLYTVRVDRDLPELAHDTLVGNASAVPDMFVMRRTTIGGNRGMGIRLKTRGALIEDCLFEDTLGAAIWVSCEFEKTSNAAEGISNRNITIRNNRILRAGAMMGPEQGAITVTTGRDRSFPFVHRDLLIEGNTIEDAFGFGIRLTSSDGVRVTGNTITGATNAAVSVSSSRNIVVEENEFTSRAPSPDSDVLIGAGNEDDTIIVKGNRRGFQP